MNRRAFARAEMIAACVIIVALLTLAFVTFVALRGERAQRTSQQQAEMMDRLRRSLWRIDSQLTSIIAREAARPPEQYVPFYPADRTQAPDVSEQFVAPHILTSPRSQSEEGARLGAGAPPAATGEGTDLAGAAPATDQRESRRQDDESSTRELTQNDQSRDGQTQDGRAQDGQLQDGQPPDVQPQNNRSLPAVLVPSELLSSPDALTNMHFQLNEAGELASPQVPRGRQRELSRLQYTTPYAIETAERKLDELAVLIASESTFSQRGIDVASNQNKPQPARSNPGSPPASSSVASTSESLPGVPNSSAPTTAAQSSAELAKLASTQDQPKLGSSTRASSAQVEPTTATSPSPSNDRTATETTGAQSTGTQIADSRGRAASKPAAPLPAAGAEPRDKSGTEKTAPETTSPEKTDADYIARQELARNASNKQESISRPQQRTAKRSSSNELDDLILQSQYGQAPVPTVKSEPILRQEGFRPQWIVLEGRKPELIFTRVVDGPWGVVRQGFWLDWQRLQDQLLDSVRDTAPGAALRPVLVPVAPQSMPDEVVGRMLATVPAELVMSAPALLGSPWTPLRTALVATWLLVLAAMLTLAWLARAADKLAENRGRFVTAVTHELRTPLTSFCMYSQMLADDMVQDESARREYARTLHGQSLRLSRIVESVLDYARLGRARRPLEATTLGALRERIEPGLVAICDRSGCALAVQPPPQGWDVAALRTDLDTIDRVLTNLVDNACKYGIEETADRGIDSAAADAAHSAANPHDTKPRVALSWEVQAQTLIVRVRDFGKGIPSADRERIFQAFERGSAHAGGAMPGLGLGLALSHALAEEVGGQLRLIDLPSGEPGAAFELRLGLYS